MYGFGRGKRVGGVTNRPADDQVIGAGCNGACRGDHPLLVILVGCFVVEDRANSRADRDQCMIYLLPEGRHFQAGRHDPVTAERQGAPGARQYQGPGVAAESEVIEITLVEAGKGGYRQYLHPTLGLRGLPQHAVVAVDGAEIHLVFGELADRRGDGGRNVEQFQVRENFLAGGSEFSGQLEIMAVKEEI